ncbi:uncharacterized protein (DUF885 family) [Nocardioides luteus]|uniref:DUF885 domain-containing protein n=1 Tax=Nocardioides luteus TaxID=1844 RepID=A0ABQ5STY2_9ACTN|nr:DUF885 domain-containing protein [Nocardioides luteus]MDR7309192.1 uncharacterized protein (DUF885 family) [Nocardioides luteus]GGR49202.1 hypothetical protein GCM10010197_13800 [Nocardioides luteus]GLJ67597.1 hypothetical protein GCM10017579_16330 [Nocardioides luteus]
MTTSPDSGPSREVDARTDRYVEELCALDPLIATYVGVSGHDAELPDLSPDGMQAVEDLNREAYADVAAITPVDEREQVAKDAFLERIGLDIEFADARLDRKLVSVIASGVHGLREAFDLMPTGTEEDWEAIGSRLSGLPDAVAGYTATLREEAAAGRVSAAAQYAQVVEQIRGWTGQKGSGDFFTGLVAQAEAAPASLRTALEASAAKASEAFASFGHFKAEELVPVGLPKEAVGRDHYRLASRRYLGAEIDLEETYAWGWEELERLSDDMKATAERILPGSSVTEAARHLDQDPARQLTSTDALVEWMQTTANRAVAELGDVHFDIPEPVRRIECMIAPTTDGGIYYTGPSEDFTRPGRMWWSVPESVTSFSTWRELTTVYHEGVPGHHLQVAQTADRSELLNRWQRLMCWVSGHGEGWALYAERLMDDLGYLDDPGDRLGMLDGQSFRAARVIIDIGMHLELTIPEDNPFGFHPGEVWTPALGREFIGQHCLMEDAFLDFEVARYLGWPGQAPSYKVGERIWLQAREDARARAGDAFDLKAFHRAALDLGSLGLDPLRDALGRL